MSNTESAESRDDGAYLADVLSHLNALVSRRGISQAELSRRVDLSKQSVSRLLRGQQTLTVEHVVAFAAALDVGPAELLGAGERLSAEEQKVIDALRSGDRAQLAHVLGAFGVEDAGEAIGGRGTGAERAADRIRESAETIRRAAAALDDAANALADS